MEFIHSLHVCVRYVFEVSQCKPYKLPWFPQLRLCHSIASSFYLEESDLIALLTPGCFYSLHAYLDVVVFTGRKGFHCGVGIKRHQIGTFKLELGPQWGEGKPLILFNGWIGIGKNKQESGKPGAELHLRVKLDPDPRYVFQFEDVTMLSPQIVQLQGSIKQPIFSCKFNRERRCEFCRFLLDLEIALR